MNYNFYRSVLFVGTTFGIGMTTPALSQTSSAGVEEIIVTARRVEERLLDVPISISVLDQQQLSNRNIVTAGDLSAYVPSLATNERFGRENTSFAIRGFTQETNTAPSVAVYFADVTAPRAQGAFAGGNGAGVGSFFDLQNVQVLRGPQGTLFGRNTTGGAVLLVPQKPTGEFEGYAEASAGDYEMRRLQGVLNVPFGDTVRFRLGADAQDQDGYLENKSGIGPEDFNDVNYWAVRASLVVDITPNLENYSIASISDSDTHGSYPRMAICDITNNRGAAAIVAPLACAQIARQNARGDDFYDVENGNPFASQRTRQRQFINTTTWSATDTLTVKNIASYAQYKQAQTMNLFGDNFALGPNVPFSWVNIYTDPARGNSAAQSTFTEELQLQGRSFDDLLTWQTGLYFEKSAPLDGFQGTLAPILLSCRNALSLQCFDPVGAAARRPVGSLQNSLTEYDFRNLGAYAQGTYKLTDQLSLTAGARYTSDRTEGTGRIRLATFPTPNTPVFRCADPLALAPDCERTFIAKSEKPTWMVDLEYKPLEDVMLYAKYARGYRQGGVNASSAAFQTWQPEKVDSYEIGAKTSFDGAVPGTFNITAFYNDFSNQQLLAQFQSVPPNAPVTGLVNAGKSQIQGVEVDGAISLFERFRFDASYAFLDTELESFTPPAFDPTRYLGVQAVAAVGGDLTLSPRHKVTVTGAYNLPLPETLGSVSIAATYTHTDEQLVDSASPIGILPATDLLNLNLNWEQVLGKPLDISIFAINVADKEYATYVSSGFTSTGFDGLVVGAPRMFGARLRYRFGH